LRSTSARPRSDVRLPGNAGDPPLPRHARLEPQLRDPEPPYSNIEAGEDRLRLLARDQLGQPVQDDKVRVEIVDYEPVR
jgi:hypothetical protein